MHPPPLAFDGSVRRTDPDICATARGVEQNVFSGRSDRRQVSTAGRRVGRRLKPSERSGPAQQGIDHLELPTAAAFGRQRNIAAVVVGDGLADRHVAGGDDLDVVVGGVLIRNGRRRIENRDA